MKLSENRFLLMVLCVFLLTEVPIWPNAQNITRAAETAKKSSDSSIQMLMALLENAKIKEQTTGLIPKPQVVKWDKGSFTLNANTRIYGNGQALTEAATFLFAIRPALGFDIALKQISTPPNTSQLHNAILLEITKVCTGNPYFDNKIGNEGYSLSVKPEVVIVKARTKTGLFYGLQTLKQLMPPAIYAKHVVQNVKWEIPCVKITDWPRFRWRGMMLDVSRHFFPAEYIKRYIDLLAEHKINIFHWHLTDDDGWRIEIKTYPKLTKIGAWRGPNEKLPPSRGSGDKKYGGFYTQNQIRDIVKYAARRHINVMPEIDMPGHCRAIAAAYPETLPDTDIPAKAAQNKKATGNKKPQIPNAISPAKQENYKMIDTIFKEVAGLFPFAYVHIGGDEVNHKLWARSRRVELLMKQKYLKNLRQVQGYFTMRLNNILHKYGKKMIGWNEILGGGNLPKDTAVMSWISIKPGVSAAKRGYSVIMSPGPYAYFDMKYPGPGERGHWWAGRINTQKVYSFDPTGIAHLDASTAKNILGTQACLWTEFVENSQRIEYQTFPRLCALCEVAWTAQKQRSWPDFQSRMARELYRLAAQDVLFRIPPPTATVKEAIVTIYPAYPSLPVRYTLNGTQPTANSALYRKPFLCPDVKKLRMVTFIDKRSSKIVTGAQREAFAHWMPDMLDKNYQKVVFDATKAINRSGQWKLEFRYTKGKNALVIRSATLREDGMVIASDNHEGIAGGKHKNNVYRFNVKKYNPAAKYEIIADIHGESGTKSEGNLILEHSKR